LSVLGGKIGRQLLGQPGPRLSGPIRVSGGRFFGNGRWQFSYPAARLDVALPRLRRAVGIPCQGLCHGKRHAMHEPFAQRLAAELLGHALQEDMPEIGRDRLRSLHQFMHLRAGESERPHCLPRGRVPRRSFRQAGAIRNTTRRICPVKRTPPPIVTAPLSRSRGSSQPRRSAETTGQTFTSLPVPSRCTLGLSCRAACQQTLDQLTSLTANSADEGASLSPAIWKRPSQSKPAKLPV
jgi:hypothetical protein